MQNIIYADAASYRAVVGKTDSGEDAEILADLTAISRHIDGKLGRFFGKDTEDVERIYIPKGNQLTLWIDDLSGIPTKVELAIFPNTEYSEVSPSYYELQPPNAPYEPESRPYTRLYFLYHMLSPSCRVKITGKFGWLAVPFAIQRACIHLTAILRLETPRATRRIQELGDTIEASPDAQGLIKQLLDNFQRYSYP